MGYDTMISSGVAWNEKRVSMFWTVGLLGNHASPSVLQAVLGFMTGCESLVLTKRQGFESIEQSWHCIFVHIAQGFVMCERRKFVALDVLKHGCTF
jgi:hypothetical protein